MSHRPSFSVRIRLAFLALGLTAIALTGVLAQRAAADALRAATYERLTAIRETKKRQVETYLVEAISFVEALGRTRSTVEALQGFQRAWPPSSTSYASVREQQEGALAGVAAALDFEDLLLISADGGRILYSARNSAQTGLTLEAIGDVTLSEAFRVILQEGAPPRIADYSPYPDDGIGAFATAPVMDGEQRLGLIAARLSISKIDAIMTGGGRWREEGLGESGETYLVGSDLFMRSDSRFLMESPEDYYSQIRAQGQSAERVERIRRNRSTVLAQPVDTDASSRALAGETGMGEIADYRGIAVLSAFTPLEIPGLDWVLLSEIDVAEAFAPVVALRRQTFFLALAVSAIFMCLGYMFSKRTTKPLLALTDAVERLGRDDWRGIGQLSAFETADDEVARLAFQFDEVSARLRETTVSRDHLDDLLGSLLNAVFTIGPIGSATDDPGLVRTRSANPAAVALLGYRESDLKALPLKQLFAGENALSWLDDLRLEGTTPAAENALKTKDGRIIPVLFAAAKVRSRRRDSAADAVCVAQDITDRKAAERRLRALNQRLLSAHEEERSRLARELHDDVTQRLGVLAIDAGNLSLRTGFPESHRPALDDIKEQAIRLAEDVQSLSRGLHPSILDDLGLVAALRSETQALRGRLEISVSFAAEDPPVDFPQSSALALYRIAQESFHNIARHAQASEVNVELIASSDVVRLRIEDDGIGFDIDQIQRGGLGIASLAERARLAGGHLTINSKPGHGVKTMVELPVAVSGGVSS